MSETPYPHAISEPVVIAHTNTLTHASTRAGAAYAIILSRPHMQRHLHAQTHAILCHTVKPRSNGFQGGKKKRTLFFDQGLLST